MRLDVKAFAIAGAAIGGLKVLKVLLIRQVVPGYGESFVQLLVSLFPGFHGVPGVGSVLTALGYVMVDAAVWAAVMAWLYNRAAGARQS